MCSIGKHKRQTLNMRFVRDVAPQNQSTTFKDTKYVSGKMQVLTYPERLW